MKVLMSIGFGDPVTALAANIASIETPSERGCVKVLRPGRA
jgi:hypothetical protein